MRNKKKNFNKNPSYLFIPFHVLIKNYNRILRCSKRKISGYFITEPPSKC